MPASAPSSATVSAIARLKHGALELYMQVLTEEVDGICPLTSEQIADLIGCDKRSVERKADVLRKAGYLKGGSGMWKTMIPDAPAQVTDKHVAAATKMSHDPGDCDKNVAPTTDLSVTNASPPPLTLPTPVRENAFVVLVNEQNDDDGEEPPKPPFEQAWDAYPHVPGRSKRGLSQRAWSKQKLDGKLAQVLRSLDSWRATPDWRRERGAFVPGMQTWLNQGCWAELPEARASPPDDQDLQVEDFLLMAAGGRR